MVGLGNEIHREFANTLSEWRHLADYYVRLCLRYRESAIDELTQAISSQWHLRPSIEQVRDIASNGFAETISILQEQATKEEYKALFDQAARRVWRIANEIRTCAEQLTSGT